MDPTGDNSSHNCVGSNVMVPRFGTTKRLERGSNSSVKREERPLSPLDYNTWLSSQLNYLICFKAIELFLFCSTHKLGYCPTKNLIH